MDLSTLEFPLTVDFGGKEYWIGETESYKYGEAVTALLIGEDCAQAKGDRLSLVQELEVYLKTFGDILQPYPQGAEPTDEMFEQLKQSSAECSVNYAYRKAKSGFRLLERYTFPSLRDFLYVELGKSIIRGNAPRKCRLCGGWFLHERGGGLSIVSASPPARRSRPAGKSERGRFLRRRSRMRTPGSCTNEHTKNIMLDS